MGPYFAKDYTGEAFVLFGKGHLTALLIVLTLCLAFIPLKDRLDEKGRRNIRYTLAGLLFVNEISWHIWAYYWGLWSIQTMLPLHMCSVMVWSSLYMLLTNHYGVYEVAYFLGVGGAMQALITPDASIYGFPHYRAFNTFIAHGLLFAIPIYMTIVEGYRPTLKSFKRVFIWTNIYMVIVFFINLAIGSNYLFIAHKPEFPTLLDILAPWPWYILQLEAIASVILFLLYLPFLIKDKVSAPALIKTA